MHARRSRIVKALGAMVIAAALGACASTGAMEAAETTLVVENNLVGTMSLTVYAVPQVGSRIRVGTVGAGDTETLRFSPMGSGGRYRFVAESMAGTDLVSHPITFSAGATLRWDLNANIINVESG